MATEKQLGKRFTEMLDETATKQEVAEMVNALIEFVKKFKAEIQQNVAQHMDGMSNEVKGAFGTLKQTEERLSKSVNENKEITKSEARTITRLLQQEIKRIEDMIPDPTDLSPLEERIEAKSKELEAKIPSLPEEISPTKTRDKLESLQGDERLDKSAIKGLDELEKTITSKIPTHIQTPAKAYRIRLADCSSQCDGANKTFNVGGTHFGIIGVFSTQDPQVYLPIVDYTETATGFTLTGAVSAPATGQSLIAQFLK